MKRFLIIALGIIVSVLIGCSNDPDPDPSTCSDGIMNGNETDIDCGGDCQPCFDCLSNYCVYLSGGTSDGPDASITWEGLNEGFTCFNKGEWVEPYTDRDGNPKLANGNWS
ncbi:MAG: hypothetical protein ACWGNV_06715, partial [Bacteroidales bacterium]